LIDPWLLGSLTTMEFMKYAHAAADTNPDPTFRKLKQIKEAFRVKYREGVVIAFSGGVDSSVIAKLAKDTLETKCVAVTADTESIPREELARATELAAQIGIRHIVRSHAELADPRYVANPENRCYFCKGGLATVLQDVAKETGFTIIADGVNQSDAGEHRPGIQAMDEAKVWHPLLEFEVTKEQVRKIAKTLGLANWNKPSTPCLSSRIPYGSPVTEDKLRRIEAGEAALHELGFPQVRVRTYDTLARIEVPGPDLVRSVTAGTREKIVEQLKAAGYGFVTVDIEGYRPGSMDESILTPPDATKQAQELGGAASVLKAMGFPQARVVKYDVLARIEVPLGDLPRFFDPRIREEVIMKFRAAGYQYTTVDLEGYRTPATIGTMPDWAKTRLELKPA